MITTPDYDAAAIRAMETLIKHQTHAAPVDPFTMIKSTPGVIVISFTEMSARFGVDRENIISITDRNQDAITTVKPSGGDLEYVIMYNQQLPYYLMQRALARELGHIVLRHDGSRPEAVRTEEALTFARHLLCPRPLLALIRDAGIPITIELLGSITGCYRRCLEGMRKTPGTHVPPELNRIVKEQFEAYARNFISYAMTVKDEDTSEIADFGTYMDNYEE